MPKVQTTLDLDANDDPVSRLYFQGKTDQRALRIGVIIDGGQVTRVGLSVLDDLYRADFVDIVCAICAAGAPGSETCEQNDMSLSIDSCSSIAARCYDFLIDSRNKEVPDPFEVSHDLTLRHLPQIDGAAVDAIARIRSLEIDVLLHLGSRTLPIQLAGAAAYGLWTFHYGDSSRYERNVPYLSELIARDPVVAAELHAMNGNLPPNVLARAEFSATPFPSVRMNRYAPVMGSRHLVIQKLNELHRFGWQHLVDTSVDNVGESKAKANPGSIATTTWMLSEAVRKVKIRLQRTPMTDHWRVGIRTSSTPLISEFDREAALSQFRWIDSPKGVFWADPFLFAQNDQMWLFFEEFPYQAPRAHLSCCRLDEHGALQEVTPILRRPYHLSYPHVFEHGGEIFMIPESTDSNQVELWRARHFPDDWVLEKALLPLACVDATVFFQDDHWWMFTSPMSVSGHAPITLLFFARHLTGPWIHHPASPVTRSVRLARGAGQVFRHGTQIIRPSQDCGIDYGYSLVFNEITRIDESGYAERKVATVLPSSTPGLHGVHTYNRVGNIEVIDGKFRFPSKDV